MKIFIRILAIFVISLTIIISIGYFSLKSGFNIDDLSFSNIHITNAHLILEQKLALKIEKISVQAAEIKSADQSTDKSSAGSKPAYIRDVIRAVNLIERWFASIDIKQIVAGTFNASFQYRENDSGQLNISSPQVNLQSQISTNGEFLLVDLQQISSTKYKSRAKGLLRFSSQQRTMTATVEGLVADTLPLHVEIKADTKQLSFSGKGTEPVASIAPIVELFNLGPSISPWIVDYLSASQISLSSISGTIPYDKPESILQTLHAIADVKETEYTFAQGLEPIKAAQTEVEFINGVLKIKPYQATFYGQDAGNSELDINFSKQPFILTTYIRTSAQASGGILTLLEHYGIPFPFEQKTGLTKTDLTLAINLSTIDIQSKGTFKAVTSSFEFDGHTVDVDQLDVDLNNTDITIHRIDVSQKDLFAASIKGELDAAKSTGDLHASISDFSYHSKDSELLLANPDKAPLEIDYHMRPDGDSISIPASTWQSGDHAISIGEFTTPFSHTSWSGKIPVTAVNISPWIKSTVSGTFSRQPPYANLDITILELTRDTWRINQPRTQLELIIGDEISLKTKNPVDIAYGDTTIKLMPAYLSYRSDQLDIHQGGIKLAGQSFPSITGRLDFKNNRGKLKLDPLHIVDSTGMKLLAAEKPVTIDVVLEEEFTRAEIPMFGLKFEQQKQGAWSVAVNDLGALNKYSPVMQHYDLEKGHFALRSNTGSKPWTFKGKLTYPFALLIDEKTPVFDYTFNGTYDDNNTVVDINDKVHVKLAEKISITSNDIGFNLPAMIKTSKKNPATQAAKETRRDTGVSPLNHPEKSDAATNAGLALELTAKNSFIYANDTHRLLAEQLNVTLHNGSIQADLKNGKGFATMELKDNKLSLVGKGFDTTFINEMMDTTKLKEGRLGFEASGSFDNLDAVIHINDAVIKDYGLASNVLAFINTVPALLTFSLPGFSTDGLRARELTTAVNYQQGMIKLKSIDVDSKEINIRGEGYLDLNNDTVDITLNLITGLKKSIGRVPLLGYVLSGNKKKPSITLTVKGDLHDPTVSHTAFREVATYPWELLKNTVTLPSHLVDKVRRNTDDDSSDENLTDKENKK
jgi:hypothetical protein